MEWWRRRREQQKLIKGLEILPSVISRPTPGSLNPPSLPESLWVPHAKKDWEDFRLNLAVASGNIVVGRNMEPPAPDTPRVPRQALPPLIEMPLAQEAS